MAVLNNIRKQGVFLIIIIALALFAFILSSVIDNGGFSSQKDQNTIATINGEDISRIDFSNRLQATQQNSQRQFTTVQAVDQVWETIVQQTLIKEQLEKLGIDVGNAQINDALAQQFGQSPNFTTNGRFDINKLKGYIEQMKAASPQAYQQWLMTEEQIVEQAKIGLYFNLVQAGIETTTAEAKHAYKLNNTSFDLQYVKIPYTKVEDSKVKVTDAEIKDYIDKHKNQFKTKGSRDIRYVQFKEEASSTDIKDTKQALTKLLKDHKTYNKAADMEETVKGFRDTNEFKTYLSENSDIPYNDSYQYKSDLPKQYADTLLNSNIGDIFGPYKDQGFWKYSRVLDTKQLPDSVQVKHILVSYKGLQTGQGLERTQAEAEKLADSILSVVQKDKDKFKELAEKYSNDPSTASKGGEIGWLTHTPGNSNPFTDFAFSHKADESGVIETQYGYHIIFVEETKDEQKTVKLATLAKKIEASSKTINKLFNKTTKFQIAAEKGDFAKKAKEEKYNVRTVKNLDPMSENITGIGNHRNIVKWAFEKETKPGDISRFDTDQGYIVAQVTASTSKGIETVEEASERVKPILMKKKKGKYLEKEIKGKDLTNIAGLYGTQVRTKKDIDFENPTIEGKEPKVIARAFSMKKGETSEPIATESGVYIIKLMQKTVPEDLNSYNAIKFQETEKNKQQAYQRLIKALKEKADINDRRAEFY